MRHFFLAATALVMASSAPALADGAQPPPPTCDKGSVADTMVAIDAEIAKTTGITKTELSASESDALVAAINADPPQTDIVSHHVLILAKPGVPKVQAIFFSDSCLIGAMAIPLDKFTELMMLVDKNKI